MNLFKGLVFSMFLMLSWQVVAEISPEPGRFFVKDIVRNSRAVESTLLQHHTGYNNACGPTALLFIDNHYARKAPSGVSPSYTNSIALAKGALDRIYAQLKVGKNTATSLDQLRYIAKTQWGYANVIRMDATTSRYDNLNKLQAYVTMNVPTLIVLDATYSGYPLPGARVDHIVIVYAYQQMVDEYGRAITDAKNTRNNDIIEYYEPYYGIVGKFPRKDSAKAVKLTNFAFLAVGS